MYKPLEYVNMTVDTAPMDSLVKVTDQPDSNLPLNVQIAIKTAFDICTEIDYVFFNRYAAGYSSQVAAYIIDNSDKRLDNNQIRDLHHTLWLAGVTPLLYVGTESSVDIYSCLKKATKKDKSWAHDLAKITNILTNIDEALERAKPYSAFSLLNGMFWSDNSLVQEFFNSDNTANNALIKEVIAADKKLRGDQNHAARHLLLITLLIKYLEDRGVFKTANDWFSQYHTGAKSFLNILEAGNVDVVISMFKDLEDKFNGDIFSLNIADISIENNITKELLQSLAKFVKPNMDSNGQLYFWDIYSFKHIPVEVLSHIYQHFTDRSQGAIYTPPFLVNMMLDRLMPLSELTGDETILDPTCGSGIFLVSSFRRLVYAWLAKHKWQHQPSPEDLKTLLSKTIFGIEQQPEAAKLSSFSLALAICDALQPNVIWDELKFDKLLNKNIIRGCIRLG